MISKFNANRNSSTYKKPTSANLSPPPSICFGVFLSPSNFLHLTPRPPWIPIRHGGHKLATPGFFSTKTSRTQRVLTDKASQNTNGKILNIDRINRKYSLRNKMDVLLLSKIIHSIPSWSKPHGYQKSDPPKGEARDAPPTQPCPCCQGVRSIGVGV